MFSIYTLISIGIGVSVMLTELLRMAIVPVLGPFFSAGQLTEEVNFRRNVTSSFVVSISSACLGIVAMLLIGVSMSGQLSSDSMLEAYWVFLCSRVLMMLITVSLTPVIVIYMISGRQHVANFFLFCEKLSEVLGVVIPFFYLGEFYGAEQDILIVIGISVGLLTVTSYMLAAATLFYNGKKYRPACCVPTRHEVFIILKRMYWSSFQTISMNLYVRGDVIIAAAYMGASGTVALGIAIRLMGYVRQATNGVVNGVDALFSNIVGDNSRSDNSTSHSGSEAENLLHITTALQGCIVFNLSLLFFFVSEDLIRLWLGDILDGDNDLATLLEIEYLSLLMILGISFRSLNLGWMSALTGSGKARSYTPWLLPGAVANIAVLLVWSSYDTASFTVVSIGWVFVFFQILTHGLLIPLVCSRTLKINFFKLLQPLVTPAKVSFLALVIAVIWESLSDSESQFVVAFGFVFVFFCSFVLSLVSVAKVWSRSKC